MRRATTFGGVVGLAGVASGYVFGDAPLAALGVLAALSVALLAIGAWVAGLTPSVPLRVRRPAARTAAPAVAGLLLLSVATAPVVADHGGGHLGFQDCGASDSAIGAFLTAFTNPNENGECRFNPDDNYQYENVSHSDHYAIATSQEQNNEIYISSGSKFLQESRTLAWSEAKLTIANELNARSNASNISDAANESISEYFTDQSKPLIDQYEAATLTAEYVFEANSSHISADPNVGSSTASGEELLGFATLEIQHLDGSTEMVRHPVMDWNGDPRIRTPFVTPTNPNITNVQGPTIDNSSTIDVSQSTNTEQANVYSWDPDVSHNSATYSDMSNFTSGNFGELYYDYRIAEEEMHAQVPVYVDEITTKYNAGEINTTDILSAADLAGRASTDYNSTGYYSFAAVELATLGYSGDFNSSATVEYNGSTFTGTMFYSADDLDGFQNGTTYDPTTLNGTAYMAAQTANGSKLVALTGSRFTVTSVTNPVTGESMNQTSMEQFVYSGPNSTKFGAELDRLADLRAEYKKAQEESSGGGGGGPLGANAIAGIAILAAAAAIYALGRNLE